MATAVGKMSAAHKDPPVNEESDDDVDEDDVSVTAFLCHDRPFISNFHAFDLQRNPSVPSTPRTGFVLARIARNPPGSVNASFGNFQCQRATPDRGEFSIAFSMP
tara:strand:+ start:2661 stop:2975 length:315 start_codon:yes stop_codon:yes gene_type:complete